MKHTLFILGLALAVVLPTVTHAGPVIRTGESVTLTNAQSVSEDLYAAGGTVAVSGNVIGDAYLAAGTVLINGPVSADMVAVGGTVGVHAPIGDDLRAIAGEVTIAEKVNGDVFVFAGVLNILSTAEISGDVIFYGGELKIEGPIGGSLFGTADAVRVDASIGGIDIKTARALTLGDRAEVRGDIVYEGGSDMVRAQNAVVVGTVQEREAPKEVLDFGSFLIPILFALFAALVALLVFRKHIVPFATMRGNYGVWGLIGLAVLVAVPFAAGILMLSVLGVLAGIFILACYVALLIAAWVLTGIYLGTLVMEYVFKKGREVSIRSIVLGVVLLEAFMFIPVIGPLAVFLFFLVVLGLAARGLYFSIIRR